jgi:hypothetical protein
LYPGAVAFTLVPVRLKLSPVGSGKPGTPLLRMQAVKRVMTAVIAAGTFGGGAAAAVVLGETARPCDGAAEVAVRDVDSDLKAAVRTGWHFARALR